MAPDKRAAALAMATRGRLGATCATSPTSHPQQTRPTKPAFLGHIAFLHSRSSSPPRSPVAATTPPPPGGAFPLPRIVIIAVTRMVVTAVLVAALALAYINAPGDGAALPAGKDVARNAAVPSARSAATFSACAAATVAAAAADAGPHKCECPGVQPEKEEQERRQGHGPRRGQKERAGERA